MYRFASLRVTWRKIELKRTATQYRSDFKSDFKFRELYGGDRWINDIRFPLRAPREMIGKQNFKPRYALIVYLCAYLLRLSLERASDSCNGKRCSRIRAKREKKGMRKVALRILKHSYVFFSLSCAAQAKSPHPFWSHIKSDGDHQWIEILTWIKRHN